MPVLSRHTTSTRASPSIEYSSCTSAFNFNKRMVDTAKATLVSTTKPSGIIPIIAADVFNTIPA